MLKTIATAAIGAVLLAVPAAAQGKKMTIGSTDLKAGQTIPMGHVFAGFGCTGGNKSPALSWSNAPEGTKSFAVTMYDPDAPTGSGWWHWVVFNIPANATKLAAGAGDPAAGTMPAGAVQSMTDFGKPGYGGPCPPEGHKPHRYIFTVYALKIDKIPLDDKASGALAGFFIKGNALASASFTSVFGR